jgi:signal recognition particle GTPase
MSTHQLGNLSRDDLKSIMRELLEELLWELEQELPDPDAGLELRPEIAERLRKSMQEKKQGKSLAEVKRELGLDE